MSKKRLDAIGIATHGKVSQKGEVNSVSVATKAVPSQPWSIVANIVRRFVWKAKSVFQPISVYNKKGVGFGPFFRAILKKRGPN
jgi:hypothetical protein